MITDTSLNAPNDIGPETEIPEKEKNVVARLTLTKEQFTFRMARDIKTFDINNRRYLGAKDSFGTSLVLTESQKSDLRRAFNLLDFAGEGKIKAEDFRVAIKALGYEPSKEELFLMINAVDKGKTGKLSYENFETAIMRKIMSLDSDDNIMKSFRLFDNDDTGLISFENLKRVTNILDVYLTDQEIEEMIEDADRDFDGFISEQEFKKMIKNAVNIVTP